MGFPYLAPVKKWVVDILKEREYSTDVVSPTSPKTISNNFNSVLKRPWVTLTSGAKVTKQPMKGLTAEDRAKKLEELYTQKASDSKDYLGCIIRNDLDREAKYQLEESYIGVDFAGKKIKVVGESNRRISTPIIEGVEIDTDGANNTLKVARVTVRCFSLKQFEMFELFFCRPGMNVLVEFGDTTLDTYRFSNRKKPVKDAYPNSAHVSSLIFPKNDYQKFVDIFSSYYRFTNTSFKLFQEHVEKSMGSYDFVAGKVTDYSFGIEADGTYNVTLEVSQGNQMSLAIPVNVGNDASQIATQPKAGSVEEFDQWIAQLVADLNIEKGKLAASKADWDKEFFNWGKLSDKKEDETASTERYISLRFILKKLMNYSLTETGYVPDDFKFNIPTYDVGGTQKEYIPIRSHKNIISANTDILYPNKEMVTFRAPINDSKTKEGDEIQISTKTIDCSINGYSINEGFDVKDINGNIINPKSTEGDCCGNALNIFINYKILVQAWRAAYTRIDFLGAILDAINANSFGKFRLVRANHDERVSASVMDYTAQSDAKIDDEVYRFNVNTIKSNVIDFSFNFEMSNLVAGRTIFNAQRFLTNALKDLKEEDKKLPQIPLPPSAFQQFDMSLMSNADGFFSLNMIDLKALEANYNETIKKGTVQGDSQQTKPNEAPDYTAIIDSKSIKFKFKDGIKVVIFTDGELTKKKISAPKEDAKSTLSPIDITLTLDGINGFNCGEYFRINGVPEIYNQIGVFQITNTKHSVTPEGWRTTLEAQFRITPKK
jgi:hypothetical protein